MTNIVIRWTYPMDINEIIHHHARMNRIGIYYITRNHRGHITDMYIGKTTYTFGSRLKAHLNNWVGDCRGKIQVRLGYLEYPKNITVAYRRELINAAEETLIWFMRHRLQKNIKCTKDCYPKRWLCITNKGFKGNLPPCVHFSHKEWYGW